MKYQPLVSILALFALTSSAGMAEEPNDPTIVDQCAGVVFGCDALRACAGELPDHVTCVHFPDIETARESGFVQ